MPFPKAKYLCLWKSKSMRLNALLFLLAVSTVSSGYAGLLECQNALTPASSDSNETYMFDRHERDYDHNRETWDRTLYQPLRKYFVSLLNTNLGNRTGLHLVYVGSGPRVPLFLDPQL